MSKFMSVGRKALASAISVVTVFGTMAFTLVAPLQVSAAGCVSGSLIKNSSLSAVYYCGADGKRYVFTNQKAYFTWYSSFSGVQTISDFDMSTITIGGNVTYRPGVKMIKLESNPNTYAISHNGVLRLVTSQAIATCLYGSAWSTMIDDISDAFYTNYTTGSPITSCGEYDKFAEMNSSQSINQDKGLSSSPIPDTTRPSIISTDPSNGTTNVAVTKTISATFSEPMNNSTINNSTFSMTGPGTTPVSGSVTYAGNIAYFDPTINLTTNTTYTVTITTGARDSAGNSMTNSYSWFFTTGPTSAPDTTAPTVTSTDPSNGATNVALNKTVTATFSEPMSSASINNTNFTVMAGSTPVAGSISYSNNTALFDPTLNLTSNTTYTAKITTGAEDTSGNNVASTYTWFFTTGTNPDTAAPTVSSTDPSNGATNVVITKTVTATFSENMNVSTISNTTFTLAGPGVTPVVGDVTYNNGSNTASFNPTADLANNTTYTATITTGAADQAGNNLSSNNTWVFTTGPDATKPTVTSTDPASAATGVALNKTVSATFSEAMDPTTITTTTFTLTGPGVTPVDGAVTYNSGTNTASFNPTADLTASTIYTATITTGAKDVPGNALNSNYTWTFTTGL